MLEFRRLESARDSLFADAFALYGTSFPEHEQRLPGKQAALMGNPLYHFDAIMEDGSFSGILLHWEGSGYAYIEHFAVHPSLRGRSIGSRSLEAFCRRRPLVVLEIDPPVDPVSVRRAAFYQRLGFRANDYPHVHPAYQSRFQPHELVVMSFPERMTEEMRRVFRRELAEIVMKDSAVIGIF